jgi:hypothetical protein
MELIEEHPYTRDELFRRKGEETAQFWFGVYEWVLWGMLAAVALRFTYVTLRQVYRLCVWGAHVRTEWANNRIKKYS